MHVLGTNGGCAGLGNLLDNAVKYSLPGGRISLAARRLDEGTAQIVLKDSGVGILPRDMPYLFTRFYRGTPFRADGSLLHVPGMGQGSASGSSRRMAGRSGWRAGPAAAHR